MIVSVVLRLVRRSSDPRQGLDASRVLTTVAARRQLPDSIRKGATAMTKEIDYIIVLSDGETWGGLDGCTIIGMSPKNRRAASALDADDIERLIEVADVVAPVEPPPAHPADK